MKIVILEDDAAQARQINEYLLQYQREHARFQYTAKTYTTGHRLLEDYRPDTDLLLLDIQLPDMLGIDVARQIRKTDPWVMIIFVTNLAQYAIEGYSVNAFDYVLKPINAFSFSKKLERAVPCRKRPDAGDQGQEWQPLDRSRRSDLCGGAIT